MQAPLKIEFKSIRHSFGLIILGLTLLVASCQKVAFEEDLSKEETIENVNEEAMDYQAFALRMVFNLPTKGMNEQQIQEQYYKMFGRLPLEESTLLKEQLQPLMAKEAVGHEQVNIRGGGETIIPTASGSSSFGQAVASNRGTFFVAEAGAVHVYAGNSAMHTETQVITNSAEGFGSSISSSGNWLAVGANGGFVSEGSVVMYQHINGTWVEKQTLTLPGNISYGNDVVVDGKYLAVLTRFQDASDTRIIVYRHTGISWTEMDQLGAGNFFWSIDMHRGRLVGNGFPVIPFPDIFSPAALIYTAGFNGWGETAKVPLSGGFLSREIAIDNNTIVANTYATLPFFGRESNFVITKPSGSNWSIATTVSVPSPINTSAQGLGLAIEGRKLVITVPVYDYCECGVQDGDVAYVYEGAGSVWNLKETLSPSDGGAETAYGEEEAVTIHGNGVIIGAPSINGTSGRVYIH
ncbi:MAG: hypothetical protein R2828_11160 [Saprospiraceae bacterium]